MDNNVCPICGTELMTSVWDYELDCVTPEMLEKYPDYIERIRVSAWCRKCHKGRHTVFYKKDEIPLDKMKEVACQMFCEEWERKEQMDETDRR